jgi:hypothetical protein
LDVALQGFDLVARALGAEAEIEEPVAGIHNQQHAH